MDHDTVRALKQAAATALLFVGLFMLIAGGAGYVTASLDPVHSGTTGQLGLMLVGAALTAAGRLVPRGD